MWEAETAAISDYLKEGIDGSLGLLRPVAGSDRFQEEESSTNRRNLCYYTCVRIVRLSAPPASFLFAPRQPLWEPRSTHSEHHHALHKRETSEAGAHVDEPACRTNLLLSSQDGVIVVMRNQRAIGPRA
jgi:hypothetical protein